RQSPLKPPKTALDPDHEVSHGSWKLGMEEKSHGSKPAPCEDGGLFHQNVLKLEEEFQHQILENSIAGTVSQELKEKLRKVRRHPSFYKCSLKLWMSPQCTCHYGSFIYSSTNCKG
ncbi:hypothetical protein GOODEAATRI_028379, partial [Goodea atripinnis]